MKNSIFGTFRDPCPLANQFAADLVHKVVSDGLPCIMSHHDTMLDILLVLYSHATCSHTGDISENFGPNIFATSYLVVTMLLSYQYFSWLLFDTVTRDMMGVRLMAKESALCSVPKFFSQGNQCILQAYPPMRIPRCNIAENLASKILFRCICFIFSMLLQDFPSGQARPRLFRGKDFFLLFLFSVTFGQRSTTQV